MQAHIYQIDLRVGESALKQSENKNVKRMEIDGFRPTRANDVNENGTG